ncbi:hypothetical protein EW146_g4094 [Bondarzewia mesenterica]|uniref:Alternative oxidase n=1 Tax=Bondarzewia mesenterica TaxID=1095465 RepID=A0A4S4LVH0_9AGAM|nr:hypothetical protein EW146_g4094 [Bondarzewia mesenterica]
MLRTPMLRTAVLRSIPLNHAAPIIALSARRSFTAGVPRLDDLTAKKTNEGAFAGTEGHHSKDRSPPTKEIIQPPGEVEVKGDWVLFHPVYSPEELKAVEARTSPRWQDFWRQDLNRVNQDVEVIWGFDVVSRYKHKPIPPNTNMTVAELRKGGYVMDEHQWLNRILFLESIAGVPGMVAATARHLKSLRLMQRDAGWIHTLLEEAENERMHLMTFMTLRVFYNLFFLTYLFSPQTCHRFVGHLEEEAVVTYTSCIEDMEAGRFPEWYVAYLMTEKPAPAIAKDYWRLSPNATMVDVVYAVRSDESTHRFVNHSLANLQKGDVNPFALREPGMDVKGKIVEYVVQYRISASVFYTNLVAALRFDRETSAKYVHGSHEIIDKKRPPEV